MNESPRCPKCGIALPADAPAGLCPKCLVQAGFESQSALGDPGPTKLTPPASGFVPPTVEELAPLFPQLEILEVLGKGGMGAVYKARQPGLDRLVALKILPPEISHDPAFAERFQREARALARLSHPHIVAVYDFGQTLECGDSSPLSLPGSATSRQAEQSSDDAAAKGRKSGNELLHSKGALCYIVMEFVDGANLRQAIRTKTLKPAEALAIVPQICEALQFAHDEGIVHRDIKPENILIDKRGRVKIADFGLAKLLGTDASDHSLTATHQVMGTLRYMAPEQMQGSREVDHRADIYSLGVVFYELLTGELPMGKFAPPSKKVQVDVRLDEVVLRALEQDPEQRYQHASEVKTDVDAISRSPSVVRPESAKGMGLAREEPATQPAEPDHEATMGAITAAALMFAVLIFTAFAMRVSGSEWCLLALCVPAFIAPCLENLARRAGTLWIFYATVGLSLIGSLVLIAYGVWLTESLWPLLAIFAPFVGMGAGVAAWQGDQETEPGETGPVLMPGPHLVQGPADCLLLAAGVAFVTASGVALWLLASPTSSLITSLTHGNLTIASVTLVTYSLLIGIAGLMLRRLRARFFVLLVVVIGGLFLPAVIAVNVVMEFSRMPEWPVAIPLWLGVPVAVWATIVLFQRDVRAAFTEQTRLARALSDAVPPEQRVKAPAIWLLLTGLFVAVHGVSLLILMGLLFSESQFSHGELVLYRCLGAALLVAGCVICHGAWQMFQLRSYRWAVAAAIFGQPLGIWSLVVLSGRDVKAAFQAQARSRAAVGTSSAHKTGTAPVALTQDPSEGQGDVAQRLAVARFLVQGPALGMVAIGVAAWVQSLAIALCLMFLPREYWTWGMRSASPIVAVLGIPYGAVLLSAGLQMKRLQAYTLAVLAGVLASGAPLGVVWIFALPVAIWAHIVLWKPEVKDAFALQLRERILALRAEKIETEKSGEPEGVSPRTGGEQVRGLTPSGSPSLRVNSRPKLVPVLATFNLVGAIVLMLVCAMEEPAAFSPSDLRVWQLWEKVDAVLGFTMAAGMFAASIGLFLWKPWARKLTLGVCVFGLASFVFDAPYVARFVIPDVYAEIQHTIAEEGIDPDARDFVAMFTVVVLLGGMVVVGLTCLIGQLVYFTRPRVVAAFELQRETYGKFLDRLFTGAGAVVGVLSVFGPLALLLGMSAWFSGKEPISGSPGQRTTPRAGELWFGSNGEEHVMFWGPESPTVSDRLAQHLGLNPVQREAMNQAFQKYFRDFKALEEQNTRHETDANGHQITTITAFGQQVPPLAERFWSELDSVLDGRQLTLGRKTVGLGLGMFESVFNYQVEIWRVGQVNPWYQWKESYPDRANVTASSEIEPSSGPALPERLRRFWKEPDTDEPSSVAGRTKTEPAVAPLSVEELFTLKGHTGYIYNVRFSPDGKRIASASHDGTAEVWNAESGEELFTCRGHTDYVHGLAYNFDGTRLATSSQDGSVRVWDAETGEEKLRVTDRGTSNVAFSPNGERIASAGNQNKVLVWNSQTGDEILTLKGAERSVFFDVAYSPDGKWIAASGMDGALWLWDASTGREADVHRNAISNMRGLAFDRESKRIAACTTDGLVRVWDVLTGESLFSVTLQPDSPLSVTFSPDGKWLVNGTTSGNIRIWHASEEAPVYVPPASYREALTIKAHPRQTKSVVFNHDGTRLASASDDKTVKVWKVTPSENKQY